MTLMWESKKKCLTFFFSLTFPFTAMIQKPDTDYKPVGTV